MSLEAPPLERGRDTGRWVALTYALSAVIVIGVVFAVQSSMNRLVSTRQDVDHTYEVLGAIERAFSAVVGAASAVRDYVAANDEAALAGRDEEVSKLHTAVQNLVELTADNAAQQARLEALQPLIAARIEWLNRTLLVKQTEDPAQALAMLGHPEPRRLMAEIRAILDQLRLSEERLLSERLSAAEQSRIRTTWVSVALLIVVGVALLAGLLALLRDGKYKDRLRGALLEREKNLAAANAELEHRAQALTAANKELEGFSYSISHDLRSPLRAIDGFAGMLEEDCAALLDVEGRRYITVIRDNATRMNALIDDLLAFSRLGRQRVKVSEISTEQLVQRVRDEVLAAQPNSTAEFDVQTLPITHGDQSLLHQVWANLIGNAVKYSGRVARPRVVIGGKTMGAETTFFVRDNGAGFDMRFADKLFGVFQRLHAADEFPGTGVGLAIVQRIVTRHGGRVWAESEIGKGATFYFTLPSPSGRETEVVNA